MRFYFEKEKEKEKSLGKEACLQNAVSTQRGLLFSVVPTTVGQKPGQESPGVCILSRRPNRTGSLLHQLLATDRPHMHCSETEVCTCAVGTRLGAAPGCARVTALPCLPDSSENSTSGFLMPGQKGGARLPALLCPLQGSGVLEVTVTQL